MSDAWEQGGRHGRGAVDRSTLAKTSLGRAPLRRILGLFAPHRGRLGLVFVLSVMASAAGLVAPLAMKRLIDSAMPRGDRPLLYGLVALMGAAPLVAGLLGVAYDRLNVFVGQAVMRDLRLALFRSIERQPAAFFTHTRAGELVQRLTGDVHFVQGVVTGTVVEAVTQLVTLIATSIVLFVLDVKLALASMVIIPLCAVPLRRVTEMRRGIRRDTQRARSEMAALSTEVFGVSGALLTRMFAREEHVEQRFTEVNQRVMDLELRFNAIGRWFSLVTSTLAPIGTAILFLYGGSRVISGELTLGAVLAFAAYLAQVLGPAARLLNVHVEVSAAAAVFERLFEVLDLEPAVHERPDALAMPRIVGHIELDRVSFTYDDGTRALDAVSADIPASSVVALVGPSGAGKSTLSALLSRLADATAGTVRIDGVDVRDVTLASLRSQVGFVPQDAFLFHATLAENLRFAKLDATDSEMHEALERARLSDVVARLPLGLETIVGERGHRFSGGERQRIAIARAVLTDPRVLVLDEATAHLDATSEAAVREALAELMRGRTTVVIAHRLSTVVAADQILVMNEGGVAERGTHAELLARGGLYAELVRTQVLGEASAPPPTTSATVTVTPRSPPRPQ